MDPIAVRPALPSDAAAIAQILVRSWRHTYVGIVVQPYLDEMSIEAQTVRWQKRLLDEQTAATAVVAQEAGGRVVGFAAGGLLREACDAFDGELYAIYVDHEVQGRGVGRRLLTEWARRASAQGFRSAIVRVFTANRAGAFYQRLGARRVKEDRWCSPGSRMPKRGLPGIVLPRSRPNNVAAIRYAATEGPLSNTDVHVR